MDEKETVEYRTSLGTALRRERWTVITVAIFFPVALLVMAETKGIESLVVTALGLLGLLVFYGARYLVTDVREVTISPDHISFLLRGGERTSHSWSDFADIWFRKKWIFVRGDTRIRLFEYGFSDEQWAEIWESIDKFRSAGEVKKLRGVSTEAGSDVVFFTPHYSRALPIALVVTTLFWVPSIYLGINWFLSGARKEDVVLVLAPALLSLLLLAGLLKWCRLVKRISFFGDHMVVELFLRDSNTIRYGDISDAWLTSFRTRNRRFDVGEKNNDVFLRLLVERVAEGQISGYWAQHSYYSSYALYAIMLVLLLTGVMGGVVLYFDVPISARFAPNVVLLAVVGGVAVVGQICAVVLARLAVRKNAGGRTTESDAEAKTGSTE
ncbi:MAG: hypothetical protein KDD65_12085 [Bacteroidetes bacterium]|nr:hypothetical protein [Bacteroidota bacterium]